MPVAPTYPGVYVQEVPSGVRTIVGVSTSTALFIGSCKGGPLNFPVLCLSYSDFVRNFSEDSTSSDLPRYVKLFFLNGGTTCYVMRIASGAAAATVQLKTEAGAGSMLLTASNAGLTGNNIRVAVTYDTEQPEATFNLRVFRWDTDANGVTTAAASELWRNLTMNPASPSYAPAFLTANSALIDATYVPVAAGTGFSQSGRVVNSSATPATFTAQWSALVTPTASQFQISVAGSAYKTVDLSSINFAATNNEGLLQLALQNLVRGAFASLPGNPGNTANVSFIAAPASASPAPAGEVPKWLRIDAANADVVIRPSRSNDVAVRLMLGTAQGGHEVGAYASQRPAASGTTLVPTSVFGNTSQLATLDPAAVTAIVIDGTSIPFGPSGLQTGSTAAPTPAMYVDASASSLTGNRDGLREKLRLIAQTVASYAAANPSFPWSASVWGYRVNVSRRDGSDNATAAVTFTTWAAPVFTTNARYYSLGTSGTGSFQTPGLPGDDGGTPAPSDYAAAYPIVDREVDLFNILALPSASGLNQSLLWGPASVFCQQRRAILLMDAPTWPDVSAAKVGVDALRIGLVKDYAALYYPRLTIDENGLPIQVGATGAIAGLMARIDSARGVWKAPAGTEADIRGITGLDRRFSDLENGVLNPKAINTLRVFPEGVVCWGARTMDGDDSHPSDWKYVPIRRLSLYIEESLYRGLKWVVFEPNDEPLWAQIRLNVGAFMHGLFTQGAFQGKKSSDAYFVRCDAETTTQDDRNKGIVNIWVGFAPLKPAEFVVLYLQQMAGQIAV
jgi:phage tail sheath protein FI